MEEVALQDGAELRELRARRPHAADRRPGSAAGWNRGGKKVLQMLACISKSGWVVMLLCTYGAEGCQSDFFFHFCFERIWRDMNAMYPSLQTAAITRL